MKFLQHKSPKHFNIFVLRVENYLDLMDKLLKDQKYLSRNHLKELIKSMEKRQIYRLLYLIRKIPLSQIQLLKLEHQSTVKTKKTSSLKNKIIQGA